MDNCDWTAASRLGFTAAALAILAVALVVPPLLLYRAEGDRGRLVAVWLGTLALGVLFLAGLFTVGDGWDERWWVGTLVVGLAIGAGAALALGRRAPSLVSLGVIGMGTPAAVPAALLFGLLAVSGTCLD